MKQPKQPPSWEAIRIYCLVVIAFAGATSLAAGVSIYGMLDMFIAGASASMALMITSAAIPMRDRVNAIDHEMSEALERIKNEMEEHYDATRLTGSDSAERKNRTLQ